MQRELIKRDAVTTSAHAFDEQFKVVGETCNDCHNSFRVHD